jgi:hypothetical protein
MTPGPMAMKGSNVTGDQRFLSATKALRDDNARRKAATGRGGYWIETASGPPYFVATPPAPRFRNSGGDIC